MLTRVEQDPTLGVRRKRGSVYRDVGVGRLDCHVDPNREGQGAGQDVVDRLALLFRKGSPLFRQGLLQRPCGLHIGPVFEGGQAQASQGAGVRIDLVGLAEECNGFAPVGQLELAHRLLDEGHVRFRQSFERTHVGVVLFGRDRSCWGLRAPSICVSCLVGGALGPGAGLRSLPMCGRTRQRQHRQRQHRQRQHRQHEGRHAGQRSADRGRPLQARKP